MKLLHQFGEVLKSLQLLVGILVVPIVTALAPDLQPYAPAIASVVIIVLAFAGVFFPRWPKPHWLTSSGTIETRTGIQDGLVGLVVPDGKAAKALRDELIATYNTEERKLLRVYEPLITNDREEWVVQLPNDLTAVVLVDDGNWSGAGGARESALGAVSAWAEENANKPVIALQLKSVEASSLPFVVIHMDRVLASEAGRANLMNALLYRASGVAKHWRERLSTTQARLKVSQAALLAVVAVAGAFAWNAREQPAVPGVDEMSVNHMNDLSRGIAQFLAYSPEQQRLEAHNMVEQHARIFKDWMQRAARLESTDQPRMVVLHRRYTFGGRWGLREAGTDAARSTGTLPSLVPTSKSEFLPIGYCAAQHRVVVAWRGRDMLNTLPHTDTMAAWSSLEENSGVGVFKKDLGALELGGHSCRYKPGVSGRDQQREAIVCAPVPFSQAAEPVGVVCVSLASHSEFVMSERFRRRVAHFAGDVAPYLAAFPVDTGELARARPDTAAPER